MEHFSLSLGAHNSPSFFENRREDFEEDFRYCEEQQESLLYLMTKESSCEKRLLDDSVTQFAHEYIKCLRYVVTWSVELFTDCVMLLLAESTISNI